MSDLMLDAVAVRVLGALIEKESTTPDTYPLTLNALTAACNQSSNREPVMNLDEATVLDSVQNLTRQSLIREVHRSDSRAKRYRQTLSEKLSLHPPEVAVMCVLMLRGPQTSGELRTRTQRLHEFIELAHVDITLQALMTMSTPLVAQLSRQPGQKEVRYAHLLSGEPQIPVATEQEQRPRGDSSRMEALEAEINQLRSEMAEMRARFEEFRSQFQ